METWTLDHPEAGKLEVTVGPDVEFAEAYEDWPQEPSEQEYNALDANMPLKERIRAFINNPPIRVQVCLDSEVLGRYTSLSSARVALKQIDTDALHGFDAVNRTKPHLKLHANALDELLEVTYHNGKEVIEFEPPAGSRGARRREAMEQSPVKRVTYPLLAGLGKGGWALAVIVLGPILRKLLGLLPIPDIDWPDLPDLPELPQIHLPTISIDWPDINWPNINFPDLPPLPEWMVFLLNNSKVWVPIVIGIAFGVISMRNHKKSERHKRQWQDGGEIGAEVHDDHDQFLRLESGQGRIMIGEDEDNLDIDQVAEDDFAIFVPAGKWHNFVNKGSEPAKLYSIYAAPEHVKGTVHETKEDADNDPNEQH